MNYRFVPKADIIYLHDQTIFDTLIEQMLMKSPDWRIIAGLIAITAIVASLVFVGLQLRQEQIIALAETRVAAEASAAAANSEISAHADIWVKGRNNEALSDAETEVMYRLVSTLYRRARYTAEMRRELGTPGAAALMDFAIELYENPGARRIWRVHADNEVDYFERMWPNDDWRRSYRDDVLKELSKLENTDN